MIGFQAVTVEEFREVMMKYVYDQCPAVAGVGPTEDLIDYEKLRSQMFFLPY